MLLGEYGGDPSSAPLDRILVRRGEDHVSSLRLGPVRVASARSVGLSNRHNFVVWVDGQVHNAPELAAEMAAPPRVKAEDVVSLAYEQWGEAMFCRLRGDYVVFVWDARREVGVLARDQLGGRSAYIARGSSNRLIFSTEIAPILDALVRRPAPDEGSLVCWLANRGLPGERTMYEGVSRLAPGHYLLLAGGSWTKRCFWRPRYQPPLQATQSELAGLVRSRLMRAVKLRLPPSRPAGVLLSGGLDSTSVAAAGAAVTSTELRAYSATFPDHPLTDEAALIEHFVGALKLPSVRQRVHGGSVLAGTLEFQHRWEVPLVAPNDFFWRPLLRIGFEDGIEAILDGEGGDELFGHSPYLMSDALVRGRVRKALWLARRTPNVWQGRRTGLRTLWRYGVDGALPSGVNRIAARVPFHGSSDDWLNASSRTLRNDIVDDWAWKKLDGPRWWRDLSFTLTQGREAMGVAEQLRRRAAGAGLSARSPLLDFELVDLALRTPPEIAYHPLLSRPLLREAVRDLVPERIRLRPWKSHFATVLHEALTGPDLPLAQDLLGKAHANVFAFVDRNLVHTQVLNPPSGAALYPWAMNVWRLASAESWLRQQSQPEFAPEVSLRFGLPEPRCEVERTAANVR